MGGGKPGASGERLLAEHADQVRGLLFAARVVPRNCRGYRFAICVQEGHRFGHARHAQAHHRAGRCQFQRRAYGPGHGVEDFERADLCPGGHRVPWGRDAAPGHLVAVGCHDGRFGHGGADVDAHQELCLRHVF